MWPHVAADANGATISSLIHVCKKKQIVVGYMSGCAKGHCGGRGMMCWLHDANL
jgi:hypothetical protein